MLWFTVGFGFLDPEIPDPANWPHVPGRHPALQGVGVVGAGFEAYLLRMGMMVTQRFHRNAPNRMICGWFFGTLVPRSTCYRQSRPLLDGARLLCFLDSNHRGQNLDLLLVCLDYLLHWQWTMVSKDAWHHPGMLSPLARAHLRPARTRLG